VHNEWQWLLELRRSDGPPLRRIPVDPDWEPAREWLRFEALRRGAPADQAFTLSCHLEPRWDGARGSPFVAAVAGTGADAVSGHLAAQFGLGAFREGIRLARSRLVAEGVVTTDQDVVVDVLAVPRDPTAGGPARGALRARVEAPAVPILPRSLSAVLEGAVALGSAADSTDVPVVIAAEVFAEGQRLARGHDGREVGGLLLGHLCRDVDTGELFLEVTELLPARHTDASATRLTFTPETWTAFREALGARTSGEIAVGWHHVHPVRHWCAKCGEEERARCRLRGDFLSDDDRLLHRAIFPRAFGLALVLNDVDGPRPTFSLFGWRRGEIALRGFHVTPDSPALTAPLPGETHA
jgi:hypothetical protein